MAHKTICDRCGSDKDVTCGIAGYTNVQLSNPLGAPPIVNPDIKSDLCVDCYSGVKYFVMSQPKAE